jgi:dCMP deaminase
MACFLPERMPWWRSVRTGLPERHAQTFNISRRDRLIFVPQSSLKTADALMPASDALNPAPQVGRISIPEHVESWDEYFLWMATAASMKSKDPKCRVGAVIASSDNVVLSTGFNGLPRGVHDDKHILANPDEKLKIICHAEQNAILNAARIGVALRDATIFVTKFPCLACCSAIIQVGITRIYTHDRKFWDDDPFDQDHSRKTDILKQAGIKVEAPLHPTYLPKEQIGPNQKKPPARVKTTDTNGTGSEG